MIVGTAEARLWQTLCTAGREENRGASSVAVEIQFRQPEQVPDSQAGFDTHLVLLVLVEEAVALPAADAH